MMRSYDALIRLARFRVEELDKQLAGLAETRASLESQLADLAQSVPEDEVAASATREGFVAYGSYAQAVIVRKQNLRVSIAEVGAQAEALEGQLGAARAELQKYELLEERRLAAAAAEVSERRRA